jgi:hypothetical protein
MTLPTGVDFRQDSTFVTDPTNCFPMVVLSGSPTGTINGINYAWTPDRSAISFVNRSTGVDPRLAGCAYISPSGTTTTLTFTLPATGTYAISAAFGDQFGSETVNFDLLDNGTSFQNVSGSTGAANHWFDATGVLRTSSADWVSNNAPNNHTFTSTAFAVRWNTGSGFSTLSHINIASAGGATIFTPPTPFGLGPGIITLGGDSLAAAALGWMIRRRQKLMVLKPKRVPLIGHNGGPKLGDDE